MSGIERLAALIHERKQIDDQIAALLNRPADRGHIGEYIASRIFNIRLEKSANYKDLDGYFTEGALAGRSVNIKFYGKRENILDILPDGMCDYYLVMTGSRAAAMSSQGTTRPLEIKYVFLFDMLCLREALRLRDIKVGTATSVTSDQWQQAEIYPTQANPLLPLTSEQRSLLRLFTFNT